jgi:hypothetical protein
VVALAVLLLCVVFVVGVVGGGLWLGIRVGRADRARAEARGRRQSPLGEYSDLGPLLKMISGRWTGGRRPPDGR